MSHIRFRAMAAATFVLVVAFSMTALSQELLTQKVMSMEMAQTIAQATVAQCRANGYRVSVSVIDNSGLLKAFLRDDGSGAGTPDLSRRKAYTALFFRRPSGDTAKAFGAMTPPPNVEGTVLMTGGVPIKAGEETIGAIGVSGAPGGEKDEACANAGLAKVADKLK